MVQGYPDHKANDANPHDLLPFGIFSYAIVGTLAGVFGSVVILGFQLLA